MPFFFNTDVFGLKPDLNIIWFPITLMLDMPIILILTVRSNDKKKVPIAMPPTGLQVHTYLLISRKKTLRFFETIHYHFFRIMARNSLASVFLESNLKDWEDDGQQIWPQMTVCLLLLIQKICIPKRIIVDVLIEK